MITFTDWKKIAYKEAWERQTVLFNRMIAAKASGAAYENLFIFCEHFPVYTLGESGKEINLLLQQEELTRQGITFYYIDRGGDITYHGPGQLVCYPILNLEDFRLGLKEYIHLLEEAVILLCQTYGVEAGRLQGATGVWIEPGTPRARKLCAIGVRCSRYVTMHGLALNVNTDLTYFTYINPCGFTDKGVTSLEKETGEKRDFREVRQRMEEILRTLFTGR